MGKFGRRNFWRAKQLEPRTRIFFSLFNWIEYFTHLDMLAIDAFQQRNDGIFVEQKPQAQPQHERSENLEFKVNLIYRLLTNTKCIKFALTKKMKLNRQRMYFAQHDPTSWPILEFRL